MTRLFNQDRLRLIAAVNEHPVAPSVREVSVRQAGMDASARRPIGRLEFADAAETTTEA